MAADYSRDIAAQIEAYLQKEEWRYEPVDEKGVIRTGVGLKSKLKSCKLYFLIRKDGFTVLGVPPLSAGEKEMSEVMEFVTRANYGLNYGNFELDVDDGEVRYKTSLYCGDTLPTLEQIDHTLTVNILMLDRYGDGLAKMIFGFGTPKEAVEESEGK